MSNLIQYIVQDDPEEELKKQNVNKDNYFFTSRERQKECMYNPHNLIENSRKTLTKDKVQTKNLSNIKADSLSQPVRNDTNSYKVSQNTKGNMTDDANMSSNINLSDDVLIERMYPIIKQNENAKPHPYYDTKWNITVGVGNNINNKKDFYNTKWMINGVQASKQDLDNCLKNLKKEKSRIKNERIISGQNPNEHNYSADYFDKFCKIRVDKDTMQQMSVNHMKKNLQSLRTLIPNFDKLSLNKRLVLMDYMYNLGANRFTEKKFPNFIEGAKTDNLNLMLKHDHRLGIDEGRNIWTDKMLRKDLPAQK